jgi:hypothetical protein
MAGCGDVDKLFEEKKDEQAEEAMVEEEDPKPVVQTVQPKTVAKPIPVVPDITVVVQNQNNVIINPETTPVVHTAGKISMGMTKAEVLAVLGQPDSITSSINAWNYDVENGDICADGAYDQCWIYFDATSLTVKGVYEINPDYLDVTTF